MLAAACFLVPSLSRQQSVQEVAPAAVPSPVVTGPIRATAPPGAPTHGYPFFCTTVDLASHGYVEEEFFFGGTANPYIMPAQDDVTASATPAGSRLPYLTRMVVRRPASAEHFKGIVLMEWLNVTAGYDLDALWVASHEHMVRRGYAWIGVSAQRVGIHQAVTGLKAWSPTRYGALDVTNGGAITDDALCYDVYSQAARAVRSPTGVDPMGRLVVQRVLAIGVSQSAARLVRYHNHVHPLARVFDGFVVLAGGRMLRTDLNVKVLKILSETDVAGTPGAQTQVAFRQADSDHYRRWEVAGSAHLDFHATQQLQPLRARDLGLPPPVACTRPSSSRIPWHYVGNAALDAMVAWVRDGTKPAAGHDIQAAWVSPEPTAVIGRDGFGNALGGIRLSQHEVPTALNSGVNSGPGYCSFYGTYQPFDDATLAALYGSHDAYVGRVKQVTSRNLAARFIVREDAEATIREAAQSSVGKR